MGVYHSAKIRNFKQITTLKSFDTRMQQVFITLQRYEILSKSQPPGSVGQMFVRCLSLCKDTKF